MWVNPYGGNLTSQQVCDLLELHCGVSYTPGLLESTYRVGAIYRNGGVWFQRLS